MHTPSTLPRTRNRSTWSLTVALAMAATLLLPATPAAAAEVCAGGVVYVDGWAATDGTGCSASSPMKSLAEAPGRLPSAGGSILVAPAVYEEPVTLGDRMRLQGVPAPAGGIRPDQGLPAGEVSACGPSWKGVVRGLVTVAGDNVLVEKLAFLPQTPTSSVLAVESSSANPVENLTVSCNVIEAANTSHLNWVMQTPGDSRVSNMQVVQNTVRNLHGGLYVNPGAESITVRDNVFHGMSTGAVSFEANGSAEIIGNTFRDGNNGVWIAYSNPATVVRKNLFLRNYGEALDYDPATPSLDARQNWWGHSTGPRSPGQTPPPSQDSVQWADRQVVDGNVVVDPWCGAAGCSTPWVKLSGMVKDLSERTITGAQITVDGTGLTTAPQATTASGGGYAMTFELKSQPASVRVAGVYCAPVQKSLTVASSASGAVTANFPEEPEGIILQVTDKTSGMPVDAKVAISAPANVSEAPTGADGRCDMPLNEGSYTVTVTAKDYLSSGPVMVTVADKMPTTVKIPLVYDEAPSKVSGVVQRGATGEGMPGATVTAEAPGQAKRTATAGANGAFELNVPAASWTLTATATGYHPSAVGPVAVTRTEDRPGVKLLLYTDHAGGGSTGTLTPRPTATPRPTPQPSSPDEPVDAEQAPTRVSGSDRAGTAVAVSVSMFEPGTPVVYVATSGGFADALAGGPAAARQGGPILLVERDRVPDSTLAELRRLAPQRVVVLGGSGVISDGVAAQLDAELPVVDRVSGSDRFATAAAVSRATFPAGPSVAYIATGGGFADALSGGAAAALGRGPVLLVDGGAIPAPTAEELRRLGPRRIVVLGGESAVPSAVLAELDAYTEGTVQRLSGPDRYATSAAIADATFQPGVDTVYVATGENFPDALAGVPAAGRERAPLLLVQRDAVPEPVAAQLRRLSPRRIVILGGSGAVSAQTEHTLASFATG